MAQMYGFNWLLLKKVIETFQSQPYLIEETLVHSQLFWKSQGPNKI